MNTQRAAFRITFVPFLLWSTLVVGAETSQATPQDEAVALLGEYLTIDTTNPPGNEVAAAKFFKAIFDREGIESEIFESAPGRGNIYARIKGDGSRKTTVLLNHMDVVPANPKHWAVDPMAGLVKDGYLWGRGTLDMKAMGIVELMAILNLKREAVPLKGDVVFLGVADEEAGGMMGTGFMLREHFDLFQGVGTVLNEFGNIYAAEGGRVLHYDVCTVEKTPFWLKLTATGKPGHGSAPRADSAVTRLIDAMYRVSHFEMPLKVEPMVQQYYADTADLESTPARRALLKDLAMSLQDSKMAADFTSDHWDNAVVRNTIAITTLEASNKVNVIPAQASAQIDIRLLPSQDPTQFLAQLRRVIADDSIKIEPMLSFAPSSSPDSGQFFDALKVVATRHHPTAKITTPLLTGYTDCHFFREKAIPCYGFMPFILGDNDFGGIHGNDERISVENIRFGTQFMYELVYELAAQ